MNLILFLESQPDPFLLDPFLQAMFFAEKATDRSLIDYASAVNGGLQLVPAGDGAKALADDYARMVNDGLLLDEAEPFETLMERCADITARANSAAGW